MFIVILPDYSCFLLETNKKTMIKFLIKSPAYFPYSANFDLNFTGNYMNDVIRLNR